MLDRASAAVMRHLAPIVRPKSRLRGNLDSSPFFIVGSGRSGNTLLRRMLNLSPQLHIPPETFVLGPVVSIYERNSHLPWSLLVRLVLSTFDYHREFQHFGIGLRDLYQELRELPLDKRTLAHVVDSLYRYHARETGSSFERWGDKTPLNAYYLGRIYRVFPEAQFIHIRRDGIDVAYSYVRTGLLGSFEEGCTRWMTSLQAVRRFSARHPGRVLEVSYESLVSDPNGSLRTICDWLGVPYTEAFLEPPDRRLGDVEAHSHHARALGSVTGDRIGVGRRALTAEQRSSFSADFLRELERAGYPLPEIPEDCG